MKDLYSGYVEALQGVPSPSLFLDLDALKNNQNWAIQNSGNKKIRIATKSIRSVEILKMIENSNPVFQGFMTYTLEESLWLRSQGLKNILMGYPSTDKSSLEKLAEDPSEITLMVDRLEHLDLLESIASMKKATFNICIDIDLSMDLPGLRFGVYRSHIHQEKNLLAFLKQIDQCKHLHLSGVMGYEAQIAGVADDKSQLIRVLKNMSLTQLKLRRQRMIDLILNQGHQLDFVNGGGTGSLIHTSSEHCVTEVTVGSAFFAPVLFDHYQEFKLDPALFFTSPIVRNPSPGIFTILGGGYIASGSTDDIKQPQPYLPQGLSLLKLEGAGEVQTPLKYSGTHPLKIGDLIIMRHAKAGEICERFNEIIIIQNKKILKVAKTYRGEGKCFL